MVRLVDWEFRFFINGRRCVWKIVLQKFRLTSLASTRKDCWMIFDSFNSKSIEFIENKRWKSKHRTEWNPMPIWWSQIRMFYGRPSLMIIMNRINDTTASNVLRIVFSAELEPHSARENVKTPTIRNLGTMGSTVFFKMTSIRPPPKWSVPTYWLHNQ